MSVTRSRRPLATATGTTINHRPGLTGDEPVTDAAPRALGRQALLRSSLLVLILGALALALPAAASAAYLFEGKWGSNGAGAGQLSSPAGLATDSAGNIYVADSGNQRIQKFSSAGAFVSTWGWGVDDGAAAFQVCTTSCQTGLSGDGAGQFAVPGGVAIDSAGNVYVTDTNNSRIQKFSSAGAFVAAWGFGVDDGTAVFQVCTSACETGLPGGSAGQFSNPRGIATDSANNVYVAGNNNHRVQKLSSAGAFVAAWGWGVDGGTAALQVCTSTCQAGINGAGDGQFSFPDGITIDASGNVYVADSNNNRIQKLSSAGAFVAAWGFGVDDGTAVFQICTSSCEAGIIGAGNGQFFLPNHMTTNPAGDVYVAGLGNSRVQKFNASGTILAKWGSNGSGDGQFSFPLGIATNAAGDVYVAGFGNNRIQRFAKGPPQATISSGPTGPTNDTTPSFGFTTAPPDSLNTTTNCRVDAEPFASCTSPFTAAALADGAHRFEVRASDAEGTQNPPAMRSFSLDTAVPDTEVSGSASAKKTQKQKGNKIKVKVKIKPDEDLTAKVTGKVKLGKRSYKLKPKTAEVAADEQKKLALAPKRSADAKKIAKALKQGKKAKAKLTVTLTDELGNTKTEKLGVKLKR